VLSYSGWVEGADDAGDGIGQPSPRQPRFIRAGGWEDLFERLPLHLVDQLWRDIAGRIVNQGGAVQVDVAAGQRLPHSGQPVTQGGGDADQFAGMMTRNCQRRPDLGLGDLHPCGRPPSGALVLSNAAVGQLRDHGQLAFDHRRLAPVQVRHQLDQLVGRQRSG